MHYGCLQLQLQHLIVAVEDENSTDSSEKDSVQPILQGPLEIHLQFSSCQMLPSFSWNVECDMPELAAHTLQSEQILDRQILADLRQDTFRETRQL